MPVGLEVDQVAEAARLHLDRGRAEVLAEHLDGLGRGGPARRELADDDAVEPVVAGRAR